jgi:hypothetical protein
MITRTMDAALLTEIANHPEVRPFLGGEPGPLDLGPVVLNPAVYCLTDGVGAFVLAPLLPSSYELHTLFPPEGKGKRVRDAAIMMFEWMFTRTDCLEIVTKCPDDNGGARWLSSALGFRERFRRDDAWAPGVGVSYRVLSVDDWYTRSLRCREAGIEFHHMLEVAKAEAGSTLPVHAEDPAHDAAVGAACLMIKAGQVAKGAAFYSRWATFAGYATITALSDSLVDVRDAIVEVRDGQLGVLSCRLEVPLQPQGSAQP